MTQTDHLAAQTGGTRISSRRGSRRRSQQLWGVAGTGCLMNPPEAHVVPGGNRPRRSLGGDGPPTVLGADMHLNETPGVWVQHAWIFEYKPNGCSRIGTRAAAAHDCSVQDGTIHCGLPVGRVLPNGGGASSLRQDGLEPPVGQHCLNLDLES